MSGKINLLFILYFIWQFTKNFGPFFYGIELNPSLKTNEFNGFKLEFIQMNITGFFSRIYFQDESIGFICDYNGLLYKTYDGGYSWIYLNTTTNITLTDIYFFDKNEGFIVGGESHCSEINCIPKGPIILHTLNGGLTWKQIKLDNISEKIQLQSITFINDQIGYTVGSNIMLSTKNRGITWQKTNFNFIYSIMLDIKFINENKGLIIFHNGVILKTIDNGIHWEMSSFVNDVNGNILSIVNETLIFQANDKTISKSFDFGNTWTNLPTYPIGLTQIFGLIFISENIGYVFGGGAPSKDCFGYTYGAIYFTTDGGLTWNGNDRMKEICKINSISFPTSNLGYGISGKTLLKITQN